MEGERPFEAEPALVELQGLLQDDAEIVPAARRIGVERDRASPGLLGLDEQPLLAAHLGEVAEVDRRRPRRLAGLPHVGDGEVEIAERVRHQADKVGRIGLTGPDGEHLPARHFRFVRPARPPGRASALDGVGHVDRLIRTGFTLGSPWRCRAHRISGLPYIVALQCVKFKCIKLTVHNVYIDNYSIVAPLVRSCE